MTVATAATGARAGGLALSVGGLACGGSHNSRHSTTATASTTTTLAASRLACWLVCDRRCCRRNRTTFVQFGCTCLLLRRLHLRSLFLLHEYPSRLVHRLFRSHLFPRVDCAADNVLSQLTRRCGTATTMRFALTGDFFALGLD